jgi:elongation factor 1-beta
MASVVCTLKIMPESPDVDLHALETKARHAIESFTQMKEMKVEIEPIAFGLKALKIIFLTPEDKGSPDEIAEKVSQFEGVNSAEIIDVRRAMG